MDTFETARKLAKLLDEMTPEMDDLDRGTVAAMLVTHYERQTVTKSVRVTLFKNLNGG